MIYDLIGMAGVGMILSVYGLVQLDRMDVKAPVYSLLNGAGAALIIISLTVDFNLSAMVIEVAWLLISLFGLYQALRRKSRPNSDKLDE